MIDPLDVVWQILPPVPAGNPVDIAERRLARDQELALRSLPPRTDAPAQILAAGLKARSLDELMRYDELEQHFRALVPGEQNILDLYLAPQTADVAARVVRDHPESALAKIRYALVLLQATLDQTETDAFAQISGDSYRSWAVELLYQAIEIMGPSALWPWRILEAAAFEDANESLLNEAAAGWQAIDPFDPVCAMAQVRYYAARTSFAQAIEHSVDLVREAPEGHDVHAVIPGAVSLMVETRQSLEPYQEFRCLILDSYAHGVGSSQAVAGLHTNWAQHQFAGALHG
ncbi:MAG: hypothetical protein ACRCWS_02815, partial [Propionibacteriaceae bacterium]